MKMNTKLNTTTKLRLRTKKAWIITGGIALAGVVIFGVVLTFNLLGVRNSTKAAETPASRYPFELTEEALRKVNFTTLAPQINSVFAEVRPVITSNGKELFFCRRNHPDNILKQKDKQDIWVSTALADGNWSKPVNLGETVNTKNADAICSISPDGSEIIFISDKIDPARPLSKSVRVNGVWGTPEPIEIENFYNLNQYIDFYYSFEANVLLMAVEREDSRGNQDLYVSFPKGKNKWSEPVNLGQNVNSPLSDFAPFLSADGKTLFFSSYGHEGMGGCDIFQTTRLDDSWKRWSKPKNLGKGINSAREESYFSITGDYKYIYFESYVKEGVRDLFRADLPEFCKPGFTKDDAVIVANTAKSNTSH